MHYWPLVALVWLVAGCQAGEPPPPPTAPMAEDLSTWAVPELVQPERHAPRPGSPRPAKVPAGTAEKVYDYAPGVTVEVPVALDQPLDIVLEAGEQVRQIVDGDRAPLEQGQTRRWEVKEGGDGAGGRAPAACLCDGDGGRAHQRRHHHHDAADLLHCLQECGEVAHPGGALALSRRECGRPGPPGRARAPAAPGPADALSRRLRADGAGRPAPAWTPRQMVDDGKKMYLLYPEVTLFRPCPLVRAVGVKGPQLVNARQYLNVVILDQLSPTLELRVGVGEAAEVVTITRGKGLRTITCPDDGEDCPQWPAAARALARRTP